MPEHPQRRGLRTDDTLGGWHCRELATLLAGLRGGVGDWSNERLDLLESNAQGRGSLVGADLGLLGSDQSLAKAPCDLSQCHV